MTDVADITSHVCVWVECALAETASELISRCGTAVGQPCRRKRKIFQAETSHTNLFRAGLGSYYGKNKWTNQPMAEETSLTLMLTFITGADSLYRNSFSLSDEKLNSPTASTLSLQSPSVTPCKGMPHFNCWHFLLILDHAGFTGMH